MVTLRGDRALADQSWRYDAACQSYSSEWWFSLPGPESNAARTVCWEDCPVRSKCLEFALIVEAGDKNLRSGIWGGYSANQRHELVEGRLGADSRDRQLLGALRRRPVR